MKPGITGWALVNGRNKLFWIEKIEYDIMIYGILIITLEDLFYVIIVF
jgi:undecaprenyl phosphate N,N'-diacetylbacillosamine 1-phosphate transferase